TQQNIAITLGELLGLLHNTWRNVRSPDTEIMNGHRSAFAGLVEGIRRIDCDFDVRRVPSVSICGNKDSVINAGVLLGQRSHMPRQLSLCQLLGVNNNDLSRLRVTGPDNMKRANCRSA